MKKFGQIKQAIVSHLAETYQQPQFAETFKEVFKPIKRSKTFRQVFDLYNQVEEKSFGADSEMAELFLKEAIQAIREKVSHKEVKQTLTLLEGRLPAGESNPIYECIDTLVYSPAFGEIENRINAKRTLLKHLQRPLTSLPGFEPVNEAVLITLLTNQYNDKFSDLAESDKEKLGVYLNLNEEAIKQEMEIKKALVLKKLAIMEDTETGQVQSALTESILKVNTMEPTRYNLFELDNLLQELNG